MIISDVWENNLWDRFLIKKVNSCDLYPGVSQNTLLKNKQNGYLDFQVPFLNHGSFVLRYSVLYWYQTILGKRGPSDERKIIHDRVE